MVKLDFILSIIVGLTIFLTDFVFGWLTFLCGPIPVIFIMAIIIGVVAGEHGGAVFATMITWIGGILIGILIAPTVFAGYLNPDQTILGLFFFVSFYSLRGLYSFQVEGNIIEVIVTGFAYFLLMLIFTPIVYLFSFAFAPIGVVIGKFLRGRAGQRSTKQPPVVQETPMIQSTPVEEVPVEVEESPEIEEEFSDNAEN